tara:strand:+ start:177 stop:398 length:222 start_codon:yes stop_codon:yes gene_type:complete
MVIFSESYDPFWTIKISGLEVRSYPVNGGLNAFPIDHEVNEMLLEFKGQNLVDLGTYVSLFSALSVLLILIKK